MHALCCKNVGKIWNFLGEGPKHHILYAELFSTATIRALGWFSPTNCCVRGCPKTTYGPWLPKKTFASHAFPWHKLLTVDGQTNTGHQTTPPTGRSGFIQAPIHRTKRSGARASRHPPRWRAQLDIPVTGRGRRIDQWQQINPPFPFQTQVLGESREAAGQWF